jgi:ABC-2 type transport system permease protein
MSATVVGRPAGRPAVGTGRTVGIPFGRAVRLELRKIVDTRSGRWLLVTIAGLTAALLAATLTWGSPQDMALATLLEVTTVPQLLLYPVLGILAMTSEFSQRTGLVTFAVEPRRERVVAAKLVAALTWALAGLVVAGLLATAAHAAAVTFRDAPADWTLSLGASGGYLLAQIIGVVQGSAFGLLLTSPALAVGAYFVGPLLWSVVVSVVPALERAAPWVDLLGLSDPLLAGSMTGGDWAHLASSGGLWVLLPLAVGMLLLRRREIA